MRYDALALLLVILAILDWMVAGVLVGAAWRHRWGALVDRAITAVILAISATIGAVLGLNRIIPLSLDRETTLVLLVVAIVIVSLPSLLWVYAFLTGKFSGEPE